jgi:hypothetical protein
MKVSLRLILGRRTLGKRLRIGMAAGRSPRNRPIEALATSSTTITTMNGARRSVIASIDDLTLNSTAKRLVVAAKKATA